MKIKLLIGFIICFICFATTHTTIFNTDDEGIITASEISLSEYLLSGFMKSFIAIIIYLIILLLLYKKHKVIKRKR
ncbi:hypothetical protein [Kurthia massiliensis]|uniref:hypothetical protein n=1 Tax=Kurthia massiliensis TaxID=1033739 RepID=UPI000289F238|nr:hypothetical protein [Kurthia massiliensis]